MKMTLPVAWVRSYDTTKPSSRVYTTTHGASEDILNRGFRRMLINAQRWSLGLDDAITGTASYQVVQLVWLAVAPAGPG